MPARATGEVVTLRGGAFAVRCLVGSGPRDRELFTLVGCTSRDAARRRAAEVAHLASRLRRAGLYDDAQRYAAELAARPERREAIVRFVQEEIFGGAVELGGTESAPADVVTFRAFGERWTSGELRRMYPKHVKAKTSVDDDVSRLEKWVYPVIGDVPLSDGGFTRAHADAVLRGLPETMSDTTVRHVAHLVHRVLRLAVFAELMTFVPLPPNWVPPARDPDSLDKECLRPSEEALLLAATSVDLRFRVTYGITHREGFRKGNARRLRWRHINFPTKEIELETTKSGKPLHWVLDDSSARALERWKRLAPVSGPDDPVFPLSDSEWEKLGKFYREHVRAASIERDRLFSRRENKLALRAHDTRAFFVTTSRYLGKSYEHIADRTGHTTAKMMQRYERDVRRWRELGETAPVALDVAIPELAAMGHPEPRTPNDGPPRGGAARRKSLKVHGERLELSRLAAAEPKADAAYGDLEETAQITGERIARSHQIEPDRTGVGSSGGRSREEAIVDSLADDLDDDALEAIARALVARLASRAKRLA